MKLSLLSASTESFKSTCIQRPQRSTGHTELIEKNFEIIITWKICTFPFFPGFPPAAVGDIKLNSDCWAKVGLWVRSDAYSSCEYLFILGLAIIFVYCIKFFLPPWSPATNEGSHTPFPPSVCVESVPAIDRAENAQHGLWAAHKISCVLENGAWRPWNQMFPCITSNMHLQQLIFYDSALHTLGFKSSSRYESIDYWQTNHPEFICHFKGFV